MSICWSTQDVLDRIAELPADGPLPRRTLVVPRARVAHRLRCGLIQRGRPDLLAGTAFVTAKSLAEEVLQAAGIPFREGENELRPVRLHVLFRQGLDPEYFGRDLVTSAPGWEEALARTIGDLERAGLSPEDLEGLRVPAARGLVRVWRALEKAAGVSVTRAGLVQRAAAALERAPELAGDWGAVLAVVSGYTEGVEARLIRAIPGVRLALRAARPLRQGQAERVEALFGPVARVAVEVAAPGRTEGSDLAVLQGLLLEAPEVQAAPGRVRAGAAPDGSVALEEHAGVAAEIEAAAAWVARQVLERRTPLEEIAVLVPRLDPLAQLVSDRLRRLPWPGDGGLPVYVAGSCALTSSSSGGRLKVVVEALRQHLSADDVAQVLPLLRGPAGETPITWGAAVDLAQSLGTVGGHAAHPEGALDWPVRMARREAALAAAVDRARQADGDEEQAGLARGLRESERLLRDLRAARPGLEELVGVAQAVTEDRPLPELWSRLRSFLAAWILPGEDGRALEALAGAVEPACADAFCRRLSGSDALGLIAASLSGLRAPVGRFGEPAVYVGTVSGAVGLPFRAVRVLGLVDGTIPAAPEEDTVLPDDLRVGLAGGAVPTARDGALRSLHELYQVVEDTGRELVLSAPRLGLNRSYREPSSLFLEVAAALGRPGPKGAGPGAGAPELDAIRQREYAAARVRLAAFRRAHPVDGAAWLERVAEDRRGQAAPAVPPAWRVDPVLELARMAALGEAGGAPVMEGILGADAEGPAIPGLEAWNPLSASRWRTFLSCPHRFLYEHLLRWEEPAAARPQGELDPLAYGSLFHRVLERFFGSSGRGFREKRGELADWQRALAEVAGQAYAELLEQYPLAGGAVRQQQLERLRRELAGFAAYLWEQGPGQFEASERPFGYDGAVALAAGATRVFVRGFVDLIEVTGETTRIWDVKTGRCHPRRGNEVGPTPTVDAQIALYGLVGQALAERWEVPARLQAAYVHTNERAGRLRGFGEDFPALAAAGQRWLEVTAALLAERSFPRSTSAEDCTYCPFLPVCGPRATAGSAARGADPDTALAAFAQVRG